MRPHRLLLPLTLLFALGAASPAMAIDWTAEVVDFEFKPPERKVAVGDKVIWTFTDGGHTTTSLRNQPDSWDSSPSRGRTNAAGERFEHTFDTPGRYQYICIPHREFMKGVVEVGEDAESDTVDKFRSRRRGSSVNITFTLNEPAVVTYKLKGPSRRTVKRGREEAGTHSIKLKGLKKGTYRGVLTLSDDFDNKVTPRNFFVIR
jgi:plastocyanin